MTPLRITWGYANGEAVILATMEKKEMQLQIQKNRYIEVNCMSNLNRNFSLHKASLIHYINVMSYDGVKTWLGSSALAR